MSTIRGWLSGAGFDWDNGTIVWHRTSEVEPPALNPDEDDMDYAGSPGWSSRIAPGELISDDHPILDQNFSSGYGGPRCPRFVAFDDRAIYFPSQYDGATAIEWVFRDMYRYIGDDAEPTPYPGG